MTHRITAYYSALNELACLLADGDIGTEDYLVHKTLLQELEMEAHRASVPTV